MGRYTVQLHPKGEKVYWAEDITYCKDDTEPHVYTAEWPLSTLVREIQIRDELQLNPNYQFYADTNEPLFISDYEPAAGGDSCRDELYVKHLDRSPLSMKDLEEIARQVDQPIRKGSTNMNPRNKVNMYKRLLRKAKAGLHKAVRSPIEKTQRGGLEFAQPVEFVHPETGQWGFGRIMDFTRTPEGVIVDIAPHLYQEEEQWYHRDPHDFISVPLEDVMPSEKPFTEFIREAPRGRKHGRVAARRQAKYNTAVRNISQPPLETAQDALLLLEDVKAEALLRHLYYTGRAAQQAISQVEYLIQILRERGE